MAVFAHMPAGRQTLQWVKKEATLTHRGGRYTGRFYFLIDWFLMSPLPWKETYSHLYLVKRLFSAVVPNLFGTRDRFCGRKFFRGWDDFQDDSSAFHSLCTLFLLLLHQLHPRSSGNRAQRLRTPGVVRMSEPQLHGTTWINLSNKMSHLKSQSL